MYLYQIVPYPRYFPPVELTESVNIANPCFQLPKNIKQTDKITRLISASTGINGVSLTHHIS